MTKIYSLRAMALAGVCLAPLAAAAQSFDLDGTAAAPAASPAREYSGEVTVGARYQSGTSPLFGRYTGNDTKGIGSLGDFHVKGGDTPASGGTLFYEASGSNLNFQAGGLGPNDNLAPEAELNLSVGQQGNQQQANALRLAADDAGKIGLKIAQALERQRRLGRFGSEMLKRFAVHVREFLDSVSIWTSSCCNWRASPAPPKRSVS